MIKRKILIISFTLILIAGILCGSTAVTAQDSASSSTADKCSETDLSNEAVYVSRDGGETWSTVDDKLVDNLSNQDFEDKFKIGEEEASIVHEVPPYPIIIDGVLYQPEQIHLFDGQRLGFTTDNEGKQLYAFTTEEDMEEFQNEQREQLETSLDQIRSAHSYFYEDAYYGGEWLAIPPGQGLSDLSTVPGDFNDMISSFTANIAASKIRLYEDINYGGNYFERTGGTNINNLWFLGWNDRASAVFVYD